jgi:hypothetical protein
MNPLVVDPALHIWFVAEALAVKNANVGGLKSQRLASATVSGQEI